MSMNENVPQLAVLHKALAEKLNGKNDFIVGEVVDTNGFRTKTSHFIVYINEIKDYIPYEVHYEIHQEHEGDKKIYLRVDVHIREYNSSKNFAEDELIKKFGVGVFKGKLELINNLGKQLKKINPDYAVHSQNKIQTALYAAKMDLTSTEDIIGTALDTINDSKDIIIKLLKNLQIKL